jgi:hypothetical protein
MYNIGQADNLLSGGKVSMPKYDNGSISYGQYPCEYNVPLNSKRPQNIPLGTFLNDNNRAYDISGYTNDEKEDYVENTQQKKAGEISDKWILIIMVIMLIVCIYLCLTE